MRDKYIDSVEGTFYYKGNEGESGTTGKKRFFCSFFLEGRFRFHETSEIQMHEFFVSNPSPYTGAIRGWISFSTTSENVIRHVRTLAKGTLFDSQTDRFSFTLVQRY